MMERYEKSKWEFEFDCSFSNRMESKVYHNGKYFGEMTNNERDGRGIYYWNIGDMYKGEWKEGKKEGKGIFSSSKGYKYDGDWKLNEPHGNGSQTWG